MSLNIFVPFFLINITNPPNITKYAINIKLSTKLTLFLLIVLNMITREISIIAMPLVTEINELILCLITSVSFKAFIFGNFKLTRIPIVSDIIGNNIDDTNIINVSNILKLNLINIIMSPTNINGTINKTAVNTLEYIIFCGLTGKLFSILNDFPSSDIMELVIDVIKLQKIIKLNTTTGT